MMEEAVKVKPDDMQFDELMLKIRNGQIRIPDFQREFVWERSQIISLLDSVYQHFPIGSFLFWQTEDEIQAYRRIGEVDLRHDRGRSVQYVLDGQQRLTSLFASLEQRNVEYLVNGKKVRRDLDVFFDLDEERFVADPFASGRQSGPYKYTGLAQITEIDDYLEFLSGFLAAMSADNMGPESAIAWIADRLGSSVSRARHFFNRFQGMSFFTITEGTCAVTEAGALVAHDQAVEPIIRALIQTVDCFEEMLPKIVADMGTTENDIAALIEDARNEPIKPYKIRYRLRWLAGLGLGTYERPTFVLSDEGKSVIDGILRENEIRKRDLQEQEDDKRKRYFSVQQITDLADLMTAARELDQRRLASLQRVANRFRTYPFSVIHVFEQPIEIACEIFERINNSGQVLKVVDLMVAKSWSPTFNMRKRLATFREELKKEHYDDLPDITVLQCVSGVLQKAVQRKDILSIKKGKIEESWDSVLESIRQALDFLRSNLRITHGKILPYNAIVVPLSYFFHATATKQHTDAVRNGLVEWFWKVSVSNRYDSAAETKIGDDIGEMGKLAVGKVPRFNYVAPPLSADRIADQRLNLGSAFC
ncbi:MAG: DUF262 domain-containing protein, partial [Verrucomicrobia bacterium]|nr:DUF262 domain-containing protein [Verrucomicrobiota bacterium]